jgi:hypothetical protein
MRIFTGYFQGEYAHSPGSANDHDVPRLVLVWSINIHVTDVTRDGSRALDSRLSQRRAILRAARHLWWRAVAVPAVGLSPSDADHRRVLVVLRYLET